jgi:predicted RNA-binding Zn-ribbon protein involved in translation (DUF1610 family)
MQSDVLSDFLYRTYGPLTMLQWIGGGLGVGVLMWLGSTLMGGKDRYADKVTPARCLQCKWEGKVSKYHRICPKCGNQITRMSRSEA